MEKENLKNNTLKENGLQRVYDILIYPRDSKKHSDRGFVVLDDGSMGGSHWTCFMMKDNKSPNFDSFGGAPDKFPLKQLSKSVFYHIYRIQDIYSKLCGSNCLYFFYLNERMKYYNANTKKYFD